jgi:KaiC/GvpD/RAD55 family RecA-like ATPase
MDIPIEIPGLESLIPHVGGGAVLAAESGPDPAKSYFLRKLCLTVLREGGDVSFITSRGRDEIEGLFRFEGSKTPDYSETLHVWERDALNSLEEIGEPKGVLAIDSFTLLTLDLRSAQVAALLRGLRALSRQQGTTILLATDRGIQEPSAEAVTNYLSDCVMQFFAKEGPEGILRYLRIPKWTDGKFVDRNIYYDFDGKRMAIDLRRRVI